MDECTFRLGALLSCRLHGVISQKTVIFTALTEPVSHLLDFTFMLPCIVIEFFLNNKPDALIIQIYSVTKFYMFRASSLPIIRSFLLYIRHW